MSQEKSLHVVLADDHAVVREGYRRLLERTGDIEVLAEAGSGEEAYRLICDLKPDVAVLDISLPGLSGIEVVRRVIARNPDQKILVFSMHEDTVFSSRALQAGARGYVTKSAAPEVLEAISNPGEDTPGAALQMFISDAFIEKGCAFEAAPESFRVNGVFLSFDSKSAKDIRCKGKASKLEFSPDGIALADTLYFFSGEPAP